MSFKGCVVGDLRGFWKPDGKSVAPQPKPGKPAKQKFRVNPKKKRGKRWDMADKTKAKLRGQGMKDRGSAHPDYVSGDNFYNTTAWKTLRYIALKNTNGRCQCCGASAGDGVQIHVDHVIPRFKAPHLSLELSNTQVLCADCNVGKGAWDTTDWRIHMRNL